MSSPLEQFHILGSDTTAMHFQVPNGISVRMCPADKRQHETNGH